MQDKTFRLLLSYLKSPNVWLLGLILGLVLGSAFERRSTGFVVGMVAAVSWTYWSRRAKRKACG